ncbi:hypothetical protein WJX72_001382 [[Myrmecia] bisecta]|uniref:Guanylate cyclase domain-containing protein n=1 Tax=[Myrmecia] bisecta TaxID=41462 RepID=A0AAW1Q4J1_9CHLO
MDQQPIYSEHIASASVLQGVLVGQFASLSGPEALSFFHQLYVLVDECASRYGVFRSGRVDRFTLCAGLNFRENHATALVSCAKALLESVAQLLLPSGQPVSMRLGIHSGELGSGILGSCNLQFQLVGATVLTAESVAETALPGTLRISQTTYDLLKERKEFESCGTLELPHCMPLQLFVYPSSQPAEAPPTALPTASPDPRFQDPQLEERFRLYHDRQMAATDVVWTLFALFLGGSVWSVRTLTGQPTAVHQWQPFFCRPFHCHPCPPILARFFYQVS